MDTTALKGQWNVIKGQLKKQYAELTDDDLIFAEGTQDELVGRLQVKLGKSKKELSDAIEKLMRVKSSKTKPK